MKRIYKSPPPNELTRYAAAFPQNDWDHDFRNHSTPPYTPGHDYKETKKKLIFDQGELCAYCETCIGNLDVSRQKVEHYHPKSDKSNPAINWALMWTNIMAVCTGGEHDDKHLHPLPENLSCDSHKNHWLTKQKLTPANLMTLLGVLANPFQLPAFPCLFDFDKKEGKLLPNELACNALDQVNGWNDGATYTSLNTTIETALNLNCSRLRHERLAVLKQYNQAVAAARKNNDKYFKAKLAARWFGNRWPSYFTTRRILLGDAAEAYLQVIHFQG